MFGFNPAPKPVHKRAKKTAKQRGQISPAVYAKAAERAGGRCERCGRRDAWMLQCAHLVRRWTLEETTERDVAMLCGPSVNSGTCHWWVDYSRAGKEWAETFRKRLYGGDGG
ncbi:Putative uncharacterized protein [Paenibacillus sp. P22]|nr:Putative uncharacterized protein [Paenibacillus sp. P22]